ncbi:MAG: NIPSNAP family protein [Marinoscillum sp.]|uniref:NIPSNAP family protein n=1 Tax=Marinoscillum sp. TaxID=2024838 RepID=UPI003303CE61
MKSITNSFLLLMGLLALGCQTKNVADAEPTPTRQYYELKTYTLATDQQVDATDQYLRDAYLPALKRLGIANIGVFKPRPSESDSIRKIIVLLPLESVDQLLTITDQLAEDSVFLTAGSDYINASHDNPPYERISTVLLRAFTEMPAMQTPKLTGARADRVYELRSYESATEKIYWNKVDMFNAGGEVSLFEKLEFNAVFYGEVISGDKMPNLMYMTTFSDRQSRDAHWKSFGESPEWNALKVMPKYANNVSHSDIYFLYPTEYSDY